MGFSNWETQLSFFWVPKIGHDVSHQCYIANTFGDDHRSPFCEMWPMIARAYWHWLFTWKPKRCYFEIGNSTKGATLFGCVPRRATDNDGILSKIATPKCWPLNCWPEETGSQNSVWRGMNILWLNMFRILFAKDITPPLNRLWRCCTTIVALLGKWWSWQLWLWDDYDQPLAVRELPFFCFGTSLNPATLVKIPVLWRHNHRRRTCPSPPEKNNVWKVLSNLTLASPLGRIKIPHELYTWLKSWLLVIVIVAEMNTNSTPKPFGLSPHPSGNHGVHIQFLLDLGFMNKGLSKPVDSLFGLTIIHIQFKWSLTNGFWVTQTLQTSPDYPYPIPNCIEIGLSWHLQWFRI
jgi:hypothetical protein